MIKAIEGTLKKADNGRNKLRLKIRLDEDKVRDGITGKLKLALNSINPTHSVDFSAVLAQEVEHFTSDRLYLEKILEFHPKSGLYQLEITAKTTDSPHKQACSAEHDRSPTSPHSELPSLRNPIIQIPFR